MRTYNTLISLTLGAGLLFLSGCGMNKTQMSDKRDTHGKAGLADAKSKDKSKGSISLTMPSARPDQKVQTLEITLESQSSCYAVPYQGQSEDPIAEPNYGTGGTSNMTMEKSKVSQPSQPEPMPLPPYHGCDYSYAETNSTDGSSGTGKAEVSSPDYPINPCTCEGEGVSTAYNFDYKADSNVSLNDILPGSYHVTVRLIDADGSVIEEGDGFTDIFASQTSSLAIVLREVSGNGSLDIQILHAGESPPPVQTEDLVVETAPEKK